MSRHLRFVLGCALLLILSAGSVAPAVARPLPTTRKGSAVAMAGWEELMRWMCKTVFAYGTDAPLTPLNPSSTITPYGTDAPTTTLSNLPVATNSCYGTDAPQLCLP
jgi:hypothetical protein